MLIYDIHSHLGKTSSGEENNPTQLINELAKYNISKVGISSLSGTSTIEQNNLVYNAMCEYPDKIEGYCFINPKDKNAINEIDRCLGDYKMKGVKFHSWKHGYYPDNCPQLEDIFKSISSYKVHVQCHSGTAPMATPFTWARWAKKFPNIDFVFTHTGYYEFGYSCIEAVKDIPNIFVETSGQMEVEVLRKSIDILGSNRVVFGVDWPYKITNIEIEKFYELNLSDSDLENIFYKNAMYLWRYSKK